MKEAGMPPRWYNWLKDLGARCDPDLLHLGSPDRTEGMDRFTGGRSLAELAFDAPRLFFGFGRPCEGSGLGSPLQQDAFRAQPILHVMPGLAPATQV